MPSVATLRILLVDSHTVVRSGIAAILESHPGFEVVGQAETREDALVYSDHLRPDIVSLELLLPDEAGGIEVIRRLRRQHPETRVVVLTYLAREAAVHEALRAGATSYLLKNISVQALIHALQDAYQGRSTLSPEMIQTLIHAVAAPHDTRPDLTHREYEVLRFIARGCSNHEIAHELSISLSTVQFHVSNILAKLGVHNRIEAATFAICHALIE